MSLSTFDRGSVSPSNSEARRWANGLPGVVIFDLDGTLVDSAPDIADALNVAIAPLGGPPFSVPTVIEFVGGGAMAMIRSALHARGHELGAAEWTALMGRFMAAYKTTSARGRGLYPGAQAMLETLNAAGVKCAICSNKAHAVTEIAVPALGIAQHFAVILGALDIRPKKPAPDMLLHILEQLNTAPSDAVMVGDSQADLGSGRAAGLPVVLVDFGYAKHPARSLGADAVISHLSELPLLLPRLRDA